MLLETLTDTILAIVTWYDSYLWGWTSIYEHLLTTTK